MSQFPLHPSVLFGAMGVSELALAVFKRSRKKGEARDRGSLASLWLVIGAAIYAAIDISFRFPQFALPVHVGSYWIGVALFMLGTALRWWSIIHLGRFFTVNVAIADDHQVVDDGPYRLIRHPSYAGVFLSFIGLALLLFNWLAALVLVLPVVGMFLWRMHIEERALVDALGPAYTAYMQRTKRLIPFVY